MTILMYMYVVVFQNVCNGQGAHVVFVDDSAEDNFIRDFTKADRDSEFEIAKHLKWNKMQYRIMISASH